MLIPSNRHTVADLAFWCETESADAIHGARLAASGRCEAAERIIGEFVEGSGRAYVGVSWGKDSVVVAHLSLSHGLPLVSIRDRAEEPDPASIDRTRDAFLNRHGAVVEYIEEDVVGSSATGREDAAGPSLIEAFARVQARHGFSRYVYGLRGAESSQRRRRMLSGMCHGRSCAPIGYWSGDDVFGYLAHHGLPAHSNYAMTGGGRWDRDRLRVCNVGGPRGTGMGRREWEREYYGDVLRRLASRR